MQLNIKTESLEGSMSGSVSIVIVNWNAGRQLVDVLDSIIQFHGKLVSVVIIVDNASTDCSLSPIELMQDLPFRLNIIRNKVNNGFGVACNQGADLRRVNTFYFLTQIHDCSKILCLYHLPLCKLKRIRWWVWLAFNLLMNRVA